MHLSRILYAESTALSRPAIIRARTTDAMMTFDQATRDSLGTFLISELERLDPKLHLPLQSFTWSRDINLREDVTMGDDVSSFTNSGYAVTGGVNPGGKNWIGKEANAIPGVALDIGKTPQPLHLWGSEIGWTLPELANAERLGRPIDSQKIDVVQRKWNYDIDESVYVGDTGLGYYGLTNSPAVTVGNAPNGATGAPKWTSKSPQEITADINTQINLAWAASGWSVLPTKILVPPVQFGYLTATINSSAGVTSIWKYVQENNVAFAQGVNLEIMPSKWLIGRGVGGTPGVLGTVDRMIAYNPDVEYVRYPLVPLQKTQIESRSLWQMVTYYGKLGQMEFVYPETLSYLDGI